MVLMLVPFVRRHRRARRGAQRSSRCQSISGTGGGVRFEGLLIKSAFLLPLKRFGEFILKNRSDGYLYSGG